LFYFYLRRPVHFCIISTDLITFKNHIDAAIAKGLAMLGFIKRFSKEFQEPYTLKSLAIYGAFEPINSALHSFNEIANLFDFNKQEIPCTTEARTTFFGCTGSNPIF
jgi:hypothetical protein